ncbi:MAG TPA: aminoacyl-tRNA deacylase, partial [Streptosporangiaceae bacterium]
VAVVPVAAQLSLKALAEAVGGKRAEMADKNAAERATGYVTGGISPIGQRKRLPVVIDSSATSWPLVYCSAGQRGLELELAPADLIRVTNAKLADIAACLDIPRAGTAIDDAGADVRGTGPRG